MAGLFITKTTSSSPAWTSSRATRMWSENSKCRNADGIPSSATKRTRCRATFFASEVKFTKSYHLGRLLSGLTRHFLLMTATPHKGKEEDFQLCLALLDSDPFVP